MLIIYFIKFLEKIIFFFFHYNVLNIYCYKYNITHFIIDFEKFEK